MEQRQQQVKLAWDDILGDGDDGADGAKRVNGADGADGVTSGSSSTSKPQPARVSVDGGEAPAGVVHRAAEVAGAAAASAGAEEGRGGVLEHTAWAEGEDLADEFDFGVLAERAGEVERRESVDLAMGGKTVPRGGGSGGCSGDGGCSGCSGDGGTRLKQGSGSNSSHMDLLRSGTDLSSLGPCRVFTLQQLATATDGFSPSRLLGCSSGGSAGGSVYRGELLGRPVAIKRLQGPAHGGGSLWDRLHPHLQQQPQQKRQQKQQQQEHEQEAATTPHPSPASPLPPPLAWHHRLRIASEIASALLFLHSHSPPILHSDLKPQNILLDAHGASKLSDTGLAGSASLACFLRINWRSRSRCGGRLGSSILMWLPPGRLLRRVMCMRWAWWCCYC
ncbi:unnamed protein product [Closterium sp. Yama58-4]|nr:unnamed protein product [Closterium sp. Yama58-4]